MKKVLVFQHVPHEILGTFHPLLKKARFRIRYANFGRHPNLKIDPTSYDGIVILGGPMGVYEKDRYPHLQTEIEAIRLAVDQEKPVLGICLGAQLIAAALGAKVDPHPQREVGWCDLEITSAAKNDPVLGQLKESEKIFQWHQDSFELPPGAELLATSSICPNQAFRLGDRTYGFQFHLEVDEAVIERWLGLPCHGPWLEKGNLADKIRSETPQHIGRLKILSDQVFSSYIELFSRKRSRVHLGSGHK